MNFIKSNREKCFYSSQKVIVLALNSRLTVGPPSPPYLQEKTASLCAQCGRGSELLFARDKHEAVIHAKLLHIVRLGKPLDLGAQNFCAIVDALEEQEVAHGDVQSFGQLVHSFPRRGLDASSLDMSHVLGTGADHFRYASFRSDSHGMLVKADRLF